MLRNSHLEGSNKLSKSSAQRAKAIVHLIHKKGRANNSIIAVSVCLKKLLKRNQYSPLRSLKSLWSSCKLIKDHPGKKTKYSATYLMTRRYLSIKCMNRFSIICRRQRCPYSQAQVKNVSLSSLSSLLFHLSRNTFKISWSTRYLKTRPHSHHKK